MNSGLNSKTEFHMVEAHVLS